METSGVPTVSVLVADDDEDQRVLLHQILRKAEGVRYSVTSVPDGASALTALGEEVFDVALLDLDMPGLDGLGVLEAIAGDPSRPSVVFVSGRGTVATATRAMKLGAYDFLEKPVDGPRLLTLVWRATEAHRLVGRSERLQAAVERDVAGDGTLTRDRQMREMLELAAKVAPSDVSVLVVGESGTGKELIAREVHRLSGRGSGPLVALNCAAVTQALAESELFGHEKGSFTGAAERKIGLVEMADNGTLFLDEIGEMDLPLQAKLLRTLEGKRFRRVGAAKELPANFRLISATNGSLTDRVADGTFREDLYYRVNAVVLELPPLRERPGDIPHLAKHFLAEAREREGPSEFSAAALEALRAYPWPGNVRELRNVVERAALLATGRSIGVRDLGASIASVESSAEISVRSELPELRLDRLEEIAVREALDRSGWHQGKAAGLLGVSARTLHRKIKTLGLRRPG